jgi:two-component system, OmpR family, KDP operon response regulator KdpE
MSTSSPTVNGRVLIVDDEPQIRRTLELNLAARGFDVDQAATGEIALDIAGRRHPDLVILDLGLPGIDGIDVVKRLREWSRVPILVLSAREHETAKVAALEAGADDYVTKPFGMDELVARVRAALRRAAPPEEEARVVTDDLTVDLAAKRISTEAGEVRLTPTQWHLVEVLVRNRGRLVSQRQLLQEVWGPTYSEESHYLRVFMAQIRRKLEPDPSHPRYFITEPGMGYRFVFTEGESRHSTEGESRHSTEGGHERSDEREDKRSAQGERSADSESERTAG